MYKIKIIEWSGMHSYDMHDMRELVCNLATKGQGKSIVIAIFFKNAIICRTSYCSTLLSSFWTAGVKREFPTYIVMVRNTNSKRSRIFLDSSLTISRSIFNCDNWGTINPSSPCQKSDLPLQLHCWFWPARKSGLNRWFQLPISAGNGVPVIPHFQNVPGYPTTT